jgi:hypothetical protein
VRALYLLSFLLGRKTITNCLWPLIALVMLGFLGLFIYATFESAFGG